MTRAIAGLLALLGAMLVSACGLVGEDKTPDYRFRLTVEIETPEGLKTGSSVIEVRQSMGRTAASGFGKKIFRRAKGEAVAVELPDGQILFALLRGEWATDWPSYTMQFLAPDDPEEKWEDAFDNVLLIEGKVEVPRTFPLVAHLDERSAYPMMVTFGDLDDPTSVERVDPDYLAASFGEGVRLKRITVELTDDPVTTGIEERLGWLEAVGRERGSLKPNPPRRLSDAEPVELVSPTDFDTELFR